MAEQGLPGATPPEEDPEAAPPSQSPRTSSWRPLLRLGWLREYAVVVSFLALFITLSLASDVFLTPQNLLNILDQWSDTGIIACGGTLVIIAGGFDLSVGSIFALSGVTAALVTVATGSPIIGWLAGIGVGTLWGAMNGVGVTLGRINPFIVTLATSIIITGFALAFTHGSWFTSRRPGLTRSAVASFWASVSPF